MSTVITTTSDTYKPGQGFTMAMDTRASQQATDPSAPGGPRIAQPALVFIKFTCDRNNASRINEVYAAYRDALRLSNYNVGILSTSDPQLPEFTIPIEVPQGMPLDLITDALTKNLPAYKLGAQLAATERVRKL